MKFLKFNFRRTMHFKADQLFMDMLYISRLLQKILFIFFKFSVKYFHVKNVIEFILEMKSHIGLAKNH